MQKVIAIRAQDTAVRRTHLLRTVWEELIGRLRRGGQLRQLQLRETLAIGEKRQLLIVECDGRRLLIGAAGDRIALLAELSPGEASEPCEKN